MAITRTRTVTKTFTRTDLIKLQVDIALNRVGIPAASIKRFLLGLEYRWIAEISVYALDSHGQCWSELFFRVDWERNQFHILAGRDSVAIDERWRNDTAVEVERTLNLFYEYAMEHRLNVICHSRYRPGVDRAHANRTLGMVDASPVTWLGGTIGSSMTVPEVDEFTVGINMFEG